MAGVRYHSLSTYHLTECGSAIRLFPLKQDCFFVRVSLHQRAATGVTPPRLHWAGELGLVLVHITTHLSGLKSASGRSRRDLPTVSGIVYLGIWPRNWAAARLRCKQSISQDSISQRVWWLPGLNPVSPVESLHFRGIHEVWWIRPTHPEQQRAVREELMEPLMTGVSVLTELLASPLQPWFTQNLQHVLTLFIVIWLHFKQFISFSLNWSFS